MQDLGEKADSNYFKVRKVLICAQLPFLVVWQTLLNPFIAITSFFRWKRSVNFTPFWGKRSTAEGVKPLKILL